MKGRLYDIGTEKLFLLSARKFFFLKIPHLEQFSHGPSV